MGISTARAQIVIRERVELQPDTTAEHAAKTATTTHTFVAPQSGRLRLAYNYAHLARSGFDMNDQAALWPSLLGRLLEVSYSVTPPAPAKQAGLATTQTVINAVEPRFAWDHRYAQAKSNWAATTWAAASYYGQWGPNRNPIGQMYGDDGYVPAHHNAGYALHISSKPWELRYVYAAERDADQFLVLGDVEAGSTVTLELTYVIDGTGHAMEMSSETVHDGASEVSWSSVWKYDAGWLGYFGGKEDYFVVIAQVATPVLILDKDRQPAPHLNIGLWEEAYTEGPDYDVRNSADTTDNFVDLDPERFYVRVIDSEANLDASFKDVVTVKVGTEGAQEQPADDLTEIELEETGEDTGIFMSKSQLLMAPNLPVRPDDSLAVHDGTSGPVEDDQMRDRTHWAEVGGKVKVEYLGASGGLHETEANACDPDSIRTLKLRIVVFEEPFWDVGYIDPDTDSRVGAGNGVFDYVGKSSGVPHTPGVRSEPYRDISAHELSVDRYYKVDGLPFPMSGDDPRQLDGDGYGGVDYPGYLESEIEHARSAWAQACVVIEQAGEVEYATPFFLKNGKNLLSKGFLEIHSHAEDVFGVFESEMQDDVLHVFFAPLKEGGGWAFIPSSQADKDFDYAPLSFVFVSAGFNSEDESPHFRVLAHEIGHALSNRDDEVSKRYIFFPKRYGENASDYGPDVDLVDISYLPDTDWITERRITQRTRNMCLKSRAIDDWDAEGNTLLQSTRQ